VSIVRDAWLSAVLDREVFRADSTDAHAAGGVAAQPGSAPRAMYFARVDTADTGAIGELARQGFTVVDVNMTFSARPSDVIAATADAAAVEVADAIEADRLAVLDIAGSCFRFSRFHLDPVLSADDAHRVKREWVRSYFDGARGNRLFVAHQRSPVGFLAAIETERGGCPAAVIDLVGVAADSQRSGVGRALVGAFARAYADRRELVVGTQAANVPSIRLYERLGFRLVASSYVLHRHTA
jgi:ribosomal protein S18 acetylase RimI-like enzyme